jgi:hypothetical protein
MNLNSLQHAIEYLRKWIGTCSWGWDRSSYPIHRLKLPGYRSELLAVQSRASERSICGSLSGRQGLAQDLMSSIPSPVAHQVLA